MHSKRCAVQNQGITLKALELALIRGWALITFSPFSASVACLLCNKIMYGKKNK